MGALKTVELIEKLFDCLEHLKNPVVFTAIVSLIIIISSELTGKDSDYLFKICAKHQSARYIEETLVQLVNKPNPKTILKHLQFSIDILKSPATKNSFFFINDLNILLEALIRDVDNSKEIKTRLKYLELIKLIIEFPEYMTHKHKWEDVLMIISDMATNMDLDKETVNACKEIIGIMTAPPGALAGLSP